jgi:hypothetical protein
VHHDQAHRQRRDTIGLRIASERCRVRQCLRQIERDTAHLPCTINEALPFYPTMIERDHAAMFCGEINEAMRLREEAHNLAVRLIGGEPGIPAVHGSCTDLVCGSFSVPAQTSTSVRFQTEQRSLNSRDFPEFMVGAAWIEHATPPV